MNFLKQLIKNNNLIVHFEVVVAIAKFLLTVAICGILKKWMSVNLFWMMTVWMALSILVEVGLIFAFSKFSIRVSLSESEQQQYKITSDELVKYLKVSPKIRLFRNTVATLFVLGFFPSGNWSMSLFFGILIASITLDPFIRNILSIKAPFIFKPYTPIISDRDPRRYDPFVCWQQHWNPDPSSEKSENIWKL